MFRLLAVVIFFVAHVHAVWSGPAREKPEEVVKHYLSSVYARDYDAAYQWISTKDQKYKSEADYLRENLPYSGAALELSRKLAEMIQWGAFRTEIKGDRAQIFFTAKVPAAGAPALQRLLREFDPERLSRLSSEEKQAVVKSLESMRSEGTLPMIEGEESAVLVKEEGGWRVWVNWARAIRVRFKAEVKKGLPWEFWPVQETILAKPGESLMATFKAKNLSRRPITGKARHFEEPWKLAADYLEIIQCFCFTKQALAAGEEKEFPLVFRVRWDTPNEVEEFRITYEFFPIDKFEYPRAKRPPKKNR